MLTQNAQKFRRTASLLLSLAVAGAALLTGCATPAPPGQCKVRISLGARTNANPDRDGEAQATPVTFWQLNNVQPLKEAGFEDIWQRADEAMGDSVVSKKEYTLYPGKSVAENMLIDEATTHVAVTAIFREVDGTGWRTYVKLPPAQTIERCEEGKVGGPLFIMIDGYKLKGSNKPFALEAPPIERSGAEAEEEGAEAGGDEAAADDDGGKKKKKKRKKK